MLAPSGASSLSHCSSATRGALYFDSKTKKSYECNGSLWVPRQKTKTSCPKGWTAKDRKCLKLVQKLKSWQNAVLACEKLDATLVLGFLYFVYSFRNFPNYRYDEN